ncbi:MAG: DUF4266 domain-containing protein [Betaproteobacteria bacterium]|nr:DUF4266 domain-containing protein [Betaproteobacteria bacterium]
MPLRLPRVDGRFGPAFRIIAAVIAVVAFAGCSPVQPWERGRLAKPQMSDAPHPAQEVMRQHIYRSREATAGSAAARGGGCGCY